MFMLKKGMLLVLIASLFSVFQLNAQDHFSLGPRAGVNFSNVCHIDNSKSLPGFVGGLTSTYSINESSGLILDILYSQEGYKDKTLGDNDIHFSYLQIPVYYSHFFGKLGESLRPKVYIGLEPGFLLHVKVNDEDADKGQFKTFNLALSGGLGFNARVANRIWLNTDLRGMLGLMDIRQNAPETKKDIHALNNIQLSLGLAYGISKWE